MNHVSHIFYMFLFCSLKPAGAFLLLIRCFLNIYTLITWPIYYVLQRPWKVRANRNKLRVSTAVDVIDLLLFLFI